MPKTKMFISLAVIVMVVAMAGGVTMAWFTSSAAAPDNVFMAGTVDIEADSIVTTEQEASIGGGNGGEWVLVDLYPDEVVSSDQGTIPGGGSVKSARSNPDAVLTYSTGEDDSNFFSLGYKMDTRSNTPGDPGVQEYWSGRGGEVVVRFGEEIPAQGGWVILVVEDTWGDWPDENARIYVSKDNTNWDYIGTANNQLGTPQSKNTLNIPNELEWFQYVKVVDLTNPYNTPGDTSLEDWWNHSNNDAFDVNAIMVQKLERQNWNPGDCDKLKYVIRNTGSKNIRVRISEIKGEWEFDWDYLWDNWQALGFDGQFGLQEVYNMDQFQDEVRAMDVEPVVPEPCEESAGDWAYDDGYWYYIGSEHDPVAPESELELCLEVCLDGPDTSNIFQGASYVLSVSFEAVQSSNNAPYEEWGTPHNIYPEPTE